ncbi:MAG: hypothetical protein WCG99_05255, partial [Candidatus Berkelbacteria bacterium]
LNADQQILENSVQEMTEILQVAVPFMLEAKETQEFDKAWDSANNMPGLANWPLQKMALTIDGVSFNVTPRFRTVETVRKIRYDQLSGKPAGEVSVTSGRMELEFNLPVFGRQQVYATVTHTEKFPISGERAVEIENQILFDFSINGRTEQITVRSNGALEKFDFLFFSGIEGGSTDIAAWRGEGEWCETCNKAHGNADNMSASLIIQ